MAQNKNALIRYKTIDKCLQNRYRKWTLQDLIDHCSEALHEYEGRDVNVSKRSIQLDIQMMRSDKLGYNAPIVVYDKKYYMYEDEEYSITQIPLSENDMAVLLETVEMLKQFKDFSLFSELGGIIHRLEDKIYTEKSHQPSIIHLDKNENLKGLEYLDILYQAILKEIGLNITYQSFKALKPSVMPFHPYILKEFNNRWFLVGRKEGSEVVLTLALDRIQNIEYNLDLLYENRDFNGDEYYKNTIGVTVLNARSLREVHLQVDAQNAPYVLTKPFHRSQKLLSENEDGSVTISFEVHLNFELDRMILGFGNSVKVLKPRDLKRRIGKKLARAAALYQVE
ncbi:MAG: WYL domain-containing protein [Schleiferiaceae bacterium]